MAKTPDRAGKGKENESVARRWGFPLLGLQSSFEAQKAARIGEERLLSYVAFACFAAFLMGLPSVIREGASPDLAGGPVALAAGRFVAVVIFGPLFLYGLAGVSHFVASRAFAGQGSYFDARFALFWALVLGVPLVAFNAASAYVLPLAGFEGAVPWIGILVFLVWLWIWSSLFALAEGFSRLATYTFVLLVCFCIFGLARLAA